MEKAKFIKLAMGLGLTVPACLLCLSEESSASVAKPQIIKSALESSLTQENESKQLNEVKAHLLDLIGPIQDDNVNQLAHTDLHANYTISHTDVHTDYTVDRHHVDSHSNTPSKHVNDHSNSMV